MSFRDGKGGEIKKGVHNICKGLKRISRDKQGLWCKGTAKGGRWIGGGGKYGGKVGTLSWLQLVVGVFKRLGATVQPTLWLTGSSIW